MNTHDKDNTVKEVSKFCLELTITGKSQGKNPGGSHSSSSPGSHHCPEQRWYRTRAILGCDPDIGSYGPNLL
jgi:hypothetical protein